MVSSVPPSEGSAIPPSLRIRRNSWLEVVRFHSSHLEAYIIFLQRGVSKTVASQLRMKLFIWIIRNAYKYSNNKSNCSKGNDCSTSYEKAKIGALKVTMPSLTFPGRQMLTVKCCQLSEGYHRFPEETRFHWQFSSKHY